MAGIPKVKISFDADYSELKKGVKGATTEVESFGSKVADFGKKAAAAFAIAAVAAGAMAVKIGKEAITAASDLAETVSKVGVLFGDSAKQVEAFAETAAMKLGQSKQQALNAAATFATFGKAAGLAGDDLAKFSTDFVGLASDLRLITLRRSKLLTRSERRFVENPSRLELTAFYWTTLLYAKPL